MLSFHCALTFHYESRVLTLPPKSPIDLRSSSFAPLQSLQAASALGLSSVGNVGLGPASQDSRTQKNGLLFCYLLSFYCFADSYPYHSARIIGGAVCNCLIGCAESSSTPHYSLLTKQKRSPHTCVTTLLLRTHALQRLLHLSTLLNKGYMYALQKHSAKIAFFYNIKKPILQIFQQFIEKSDNEKCETNQDSTR